MIDPDPSFRPVIGKPEALSPLIKRIVAPNPSPMTFRGTNTYLVGTQDLAVIDPGPLMEPHLDAILNALTARQKISAILVTHAHVDHSPLATDLSRKTGAPVYGFGPAHAGRSSIMQILAEQDAIGGGEGVDAAFVPDVKLAHEACVTGSDWHIQALHTPGHMGNHLSFALDDTLFCGDHVMGWASSLVSPPDGDLTDFMASCAMLQSRSWRTFLPGHGGAIEAPAERLNWLIQHRLAREAAILDALSNGPANAAELAKRVYLDTPPSLMPAATRNVLAHLIDLQTKSVVGFRDELNPNAIFERL